MSIRRLEIGHSLEARGQEGDIALNPLEVRSREGGKRAVCLSC